MKDSKSKQLYAKSVVNALGCLDDEFCIEAREFEPVSTETTFFNAKKVITAVAAFLLVIGAFLFVPLIFGNEALSPVGFIFHDERSSGLKVSYTSVGPGEYDVTFDGVLKVDEFSFRFEGIAGDFRICKEGKTLAETPDENGYFTVRLSEYPVGTGRITFRLSGVENDLSDVSVSTKLPGQKVDDSHALFNS